MMVSVPRSPTPVRKQPTTLLELMRQWLETPVERARPWTPTFVPLRGPVIHPTRKN
jgi:hypothetical protein